jgi:hypothetical protein
VRNSLITFARYVGGKLAGRSAPAPTETPAAAPRARPFLASRDGQLTPQLRDAREADALAMLEYVYGYKMGDFPNLLDESSRESWAKVSPSWLGHSLMVAELTRDNPHMAEGKSQQALDRHERALSIAPQIRAVYASWNVERVEEVRSFNAALRAARVESTEPDDAGNDPPDTAARDYVRDRLARAKARPQPAP